MAQKSTIYLLPGIEKDFPIFDRMRELLPESVLVEYPPPQRAETLSSYAGRVAQRLVPNSIVAGISWGGVLAQEVAPLLPAKGCIVIASVRGGHQLPPHMRLGRKLSRGTYSAVLRAAGSIAHYVPKSVKTSSTYQFSKFASSDGWHRWAASALNTWSPSPLLEAIPVLHIHGTADRTFPIRHVDADVEIEGGKHALPISHPREVADAIMQFVAECEKQAAPTKLGRG
jgi:pimeloyl-ACP methyl ester carboxylesterase